jgi:hypothetical protein
VILIARMERLVLHPFLIAPPPSAPGTGGVEMCADRAWMRMRLPNLCARTFSHRVLLATLAPLVDYFNPGVFDHARSNHGCLKPPLRSIGNLLSTIGRLPEAEAEMHAALAITQKLADDEPDDTAFRRGLAASDYAPGLAVCLDGKIG